MKRADQATNLVALVTGMIVWFGGWALLIGLLWTAWPSAGLTFLIVAIVLTALMLGKMTTR